MSTTPETVKKRRGPLQTTAHFFTNLMEKYLPDPLVIAIMLTGLTMLLAMAFQGSTPFDVVDYWGDGFWELLEFTMQMTMVLLAGYILARTPLVDRFLDIVTSQIRSPKTAIIVATLVGSIGSWLCGGLGVVMGGIESHEQAMNVTVLSSPLTIPAGSSGFAAFGFGSFGSVLLLMATPGNLVEIQLGLGPLSDTISIPYLL